MGWKEMVSSLSRGTKTVHPFSSQLSSPSADCGRSWIHLGAAEEIKEETKASISVLADGIHSPADAPTSHTYGCHYPEIWISAGEINAFYS